MGAAAQIRLGQSVQRRLANCSVEFVGGTVPGIIVDQPLDAVLNDARVQSRDIGLRLLASDVSGLGHMIEEGMRLCVTTELPGLQGDYKVAVQPVPVPGSAHVLIALRKTNK